MRRREVQVNIRGQVAVCVVVVLMGCAQRAPNNSLPPAATPTSGPEVSSAPTSTGAPSGGSAGQILFDLGNPTHGDRPRDLVVLDASTGALLLAPLTLKDGWRLETAGWAAAGDKLILARTEAGSDPPLPDWRVVSLDPGGTPTSIGFGGAVVDDVGMSPDGRWLTGRVQESASKASHLVFQRTDGSGTPTSAPGGWLAWAPSGGEAAILVDNGGDLIGIRPDTMTTRPLAASASSLSLLVRHPPVFWSPDSSELLYRAADCRLCVQSLTSGAVRSLDSEVAQSIHEVVGWTAFGIVAKLGDPMQLVLLSPETGDVTRVLATAEIGEAATSPDLGSIAAIEFDLNTSDVSVLVFDLAAETQARRPLPSGTFLANPRWQPQVVHIPWPAWTAPGPAATATITSGSLDLEVRGAFEATTTLPAGCEVREQGLGITGSAGDIGVQVGVSADGVANFLSVNAPGFFAFAGKGFEVAPPFVVTDPGSTGTSGSLTFHDVPGLAADGIGSAGVVSGSLRWMCPAA